MPLADPSNFVSIKRMGSQIPFHTIASRNAREGRNLKHVPKAAIASTSSTSRGMLQSITNIRKLLEEATRLCEFVQQTMSQGVDLTAALLDLQVAFENACKLLLHMVAKSRQDVDNMFEDYNHSVWTNLAVQQDLENIMARFYVLGLRSLKHLHNSLSELRSALRIVVNKRRKNSARKYFFWKHTTNLSDIAIAEDVFKLIRKTGDYNDLFITLIRQAVPSRVDHTTGSYLERQISLQQFSTVEPASHGHYDCVRRASLVLFKSISAAWTCHTHKTHSVRISLKRDDLGPTIEAHDRLMRFEVLVEASHSHEFYPICIDSTSCKSCACPTDEKVRIVNQSTTRTTFERDRGIVSYIPSPNFDSPTRSNRIGRYSSSATSPYLPRMAHDLNMEVDLCGYLQMSCARIESTDVVGCPCLGFLATGNDFRYRFSYRPRGGLSMNGTHSLASILELASKEYRTIPIEDRLRTASSLASGVLHFHATPWIRRNWSSKDIHFANVNETDTECALGEPFMQTELNKKRGDDTSPDTTDSNATRSALLLSLGVVLIEIAFVAPLSGLQMREDVTRDLPQRERYILNLMRLGDTVSRELGSRYAQVVRTCLHAYSGNFDDLGRVQFEELMSEKIVLELDKCLSIVKNDTVREFRHLLASTNSLRGIRSWCISISKQYVTFGPLLHVKLWTHSGLLVSGFQLLETKNSAKINALRREQTERCRR